MREQKVVHTVTKEFTVLTSDTFNNNPSPWSPAFDPEAKRVNGERDAIDKQLTECRDSLSDSIHKRNDLGFMPDQLASS